MMFNWTQKDKQWAMLTPWQKAAAMSLMEADGMKFEDAVNVLGAMVNRAHRSGQDLGEHVSQKIYQPTIEAAQQKRLLNILKHPKFDELTQWAEKRYNGEIEDPVQGATHFLAPEATMVALTKKDPQKYRSWPKWTGYDPQTGEYKGVITRDGSHAFLAPEGAYSVPFAAATPEQGVARFAQPKLADATGVGRFAQPALLETNAAAGVPSEGVARFAQPKLLETETAQAGAQARPGMSSDALDKLVNQLLNGSEQQPVRSPRMQLQPYRPGRVDIETKVPYLTQPKESAVLRPMYAEGGFVTAMNYGDKDKESDNVEDWRGKQRPDYVPPGTFWSRAKELPGKIIGRIQMIEEWRNLPPEEQQRRMNQMYRDIGDKLQGKAEGGAVKNRGFALPMAEMEDGSVEWAVPQILGGGLIDIAKNFGKYGFGTEEADKYNAGQALGAVMPLAGFGLARAAVKPAANELGIFAGKMSRTADLDALAKAEKYEAQGLSPEDIRKGTGWFRGADKQWRYEIDDSKMKFEYGQGPIGDYVDHPNLFAAYPDLEDIMLHYLHDEIDQAGYLPAGRGHQESIGISPAQHYNPRKMALHELQHAVQNREGFTPGSSPAAFELKPDEKMSLISQLEDLKTASMVRNLVDNHKMPLDEAVDRVYSLYSVPVRGIAVEYAKALDYAGLDQAKREVVTRLARSDNPNDAYLRTAGEVEAMNVMDRADYGAVKRFVNSPMVEQNQRTPLKRQIVLPPKPRASGGLVTDKMLQARADSVLSKSAPNLETPTPFKQDEVRAYDPTWRDQIASFFLGEGKPSPEARRLVEGAVGSTGLGTTGVGVADVTPAGLAFAGQEGKRAQDEGDYLGAGLNYAAFLPMGRVPQVVNKAKMFSMGAEMARDLKQAKGTRQQMLATLKGVPKAELQQAGLVDEAGNLIGDPNAPMTRDELVGLFEGKLPAVEESVLGKTEQPKMSLEQQDRRNELRQRIIAGEDLSDAEHSEYQQLSRLHSASMGNFNESAQPKFEQYTLPGGENYREVLLKLPSEGKTTKSPFGNDVPATMDDARNVYQSSHWGGHPNVVAHLRMSDRVGPDGEKILHLEELQSDWAQQGRKQGFRDDNKLKDLDNQIAAKEQREKELKNILLQSIKREQPALSDTVAVRMMMEEADEMAATGRASSFFNPEERAMFKEWDDLGHELGMLRRTRSAAADQGLPSAPYVKDTSQWTDLGLKRALREAAEGGYDRLIITPGAEQAKRYNLSNVVDSIEVSPSRYKQFDNMEGVRKIFIKGKENSELYVDAQGKVLRASQSSFKDKSLDEIVGKDVAKKLMEVELPAGKTIAADDIEIVPHKVEGEEWYKVVNKLTGATDSWQKTPKDAEAAKAMLVGRKFDDQPFVLSGLDLDIGGKGMKDYYDKIVPNRLKDLVRKLDKNVKVEPYSLGVGGTRTDPRYGVYQDSRSGRYVLYDTEGDNQTIRFYDSSDSAAAHADMEQMNNEHFASLPATNTLSIPITPLMREEINKGLPGFATGGGVNADMDEEKIEQAPWELPASRPGLLTGSMNATKTAQVQPEAPAAPWEDRPSKLQSFTSGALSGLTANFYDELKGIYGAGVYDYFAGSPEAKKKYEQIVAQEREYQRKAAEANPITSTVGEITGAIPAIAAIPGSAAYRGLSFAQQVIRNALAGGIYSGAAGTGEGTDVGSRLEGGTLGTMFGIAGGASAPFVSKGLAWAYDRTLRPVVGIVQGWMNPDGVTAARVAGALMEDQADIAAGKVKGLTLNDWQAAKAKGEPVTLADLGGGRTQALLRSAANSSPEGRAYIENIIETRFKNQAERVATDIRHITGKRADAVKTADQLRADYDLKRTPAYKKAYQAPAAQALWDPDFDQMIQAPSFQEAIRAANVLGREEATKMGLTPIKNPFRINPNTGRFELEPGVYPNLQFWDMTKRALDKMGTRESQFWSQQLRSKIDPIVPEYKAARGIASDFFGDSDALEMGRKMAGRNIVPEDLKAILRKLEPEELELFKEGYAYDLAERVTKNFSETRNLTKAIYNKPAERERILAVFGPQGAQKLEARMALEMIIDGARQALGNSTTARQLIEASLAGGTAGAILSGGDLQSIAAGAAAGPAARRALATEALSGVRTIAGYVDRGVARRVAELLMSDNPADLAKGIEMVAKNKKIAAGLNDLANALFTATEARTEPFGANP